MSWLVIRTKFLVFSTYVEMILLWAMSVLHVDSILHVCGDDPKTRQSHIVELVYSPRMWR